MESLQISDHLRSTKSHKAHVLVFTSGKGGVGKTCVTTNVAAAMVFRGARVCIFDADTGLANINILLGLRPEFTLEHVLSGEKSIRDVVISTAEGIAVVPGASGITECANIGTEQAKRLLDALSELEAEYDYILIDTAAGVADSVLQFIQSAPCTFLIITSEPTSLTDAFSLLKLLNARAYSGRLRVLVNLAADYPGATDTYRRLAAAVEKYLQIKIEYGGFVARDENVPRSVSYQLPAVALAADSPASRCLYALADNVLKYIGSDQPESGFTDYWRNLLSENDVASNAGGSFVAADGNPVTEGNVEAVDRGEESVNDLLQKLLAKVRSKTADRDALESFIAQFVSVFVERYEGFPQSFGALFYRWLEAENYAAPRLVELVTTLEALYTSRYQQPLFNLQDSAARLVAQTQGAESQLRGLIDQLRSAYRLTYRGDVFDAQQEMLRIIERDDFTEERFESLLGVLREGFQKRFNRSYQGQSELLLESTAEALISMAAEEQMLQEQVETMARNFQQLTARRDALLTAIKTAQSNPGLAIQSKTSANG